MRATIAIAMLAAALIGQTVSSGWRQRYEYELKSDGRLLLWIDKGKLHVGPGDPAVVVQLLIAVGRDAQKQQDADELTRLKAEESKQRARADAAESRARACESSHTGGSPRP